MRFEREMIIEMQKNTAVSLTEYEMVGKNVERSAWKETLFEIHGALFLQSKLTFVGVCPQSK